MKKTFEIKKYGKKHPLSIQVGRYGNGTLAIQTFTHEEGYPEPWSTLTVNLDVPVEKMCQFIDTNNNGEEIIPVLEKSGFGKLTGRVCNAGYCSFPEFRFNPEKLKEFDEENFEEYDAYADALEFLTAK